MCSSRRAEKFKNRFGKSADFLRKLKQLAFFLLLVKQIINEMAADGGKTAKKQLRSLRILKGQTG